MDEQTGEKTLKTCWLIICFSVGSHHGQKQPRNAVFAQAQWMDGRMDGRTNRPTHLLKWNAPHDDFCNICSI